MFFKAIKGREFGGLIYFEKRISSSRKCVVEFSVSASFSSSLSDCDKMLNVYALFSGEMIHPFHIEVDNQNDRMANIRVLYEVDEGITYCLYNIRRRNGHGKEQYVLMCRFLVSSHSDIIPSKNSKELIGIVYEILTKHSEELLHSQNLFEYNGISFAQFLKIILEGKHSEKEKFVKRFSNITIGKSEKFVHSLENCLSEIIRVYSNDKLEKKRGEIIKKLCTNYKREWDIETYSNNNTEIDPSHCKGFIAMCRIALNGNEFARELSCMFLAHALGYLHDFDHIIRSIASIQYTCITDIDLIIGNFLAELSIITMNDGVMEELEMESLNSNILKLKSSSNIEFCGFDSMYLNHVFSDNLKHALIIHNMELSSTKFGSEIPEELFYHALRMARIGNLACIDFFNFFSNHLEESSDYALFWTATLTIDLQQTLKVRQYLIENHSHVSSSTWMARKLIIGIPGILEKKPNEGIEILKRNCLEKKCYFASISLAQLYIENVPGFPHHDWERALFWLLKYERQNEHLNELIEYIKEYKGVKIEHSIDYFMNVSHL